jgi:hypothetical protein
VRYETPYPGLGGGGTPDKKHFPHWTLDLLGKTSASLEDSFAFNNLAIRAQGFAGA